MEDRTRPALLLAAAALAAALLTLFLSAALPGPSLRRPAAPPPPPPASSFRRLDFDGRRPSRRPWPRSPGCRRFRTRFLRRPGGPKSRVLRDNVALFTFPGSGNTWARYLVEGLTGAFTGDVFSDRALSKTFKGTKDKPGKGTTFVVKTHFLRDLSKFGRVLTVLRNPLDVCKAVYTYRITKNHTKSLPPEAFSNSTFDTFCKGKVSLIVTNPAMNSILNAHNKIKAWERHSLTLLAASKPTPGDDGSPDTLAVLFDRLQTDLEGQLVRIGRFLGVRLDRPRIVCLLRHPDGPFKREAGVERPPLPFSAAAVEAAGGGICRISAALAAAGLEPLPAGEYSKSLGKRYLVLSQECSR